MIINVDKKDFLKALRICGLVAHSKTFSNSKKQVLISIKNNVLTCSANGDIGGVCCKMPVVSDGDMKALFSVDILYTYLKSEGDDITIDYTEPTLTISKGRRKCTFPAMNTPELLMDSFINVDVFDNNFLSKANSFDRESLYNKLKYCSIFSSADSSEIPSQFSLLNLKEGYFYSSNRSIVYKGISDISDVNFSVVFPIVTFMEEFDSNIVKVFNDDKAFHLYEKTDSGLERYLKVYNLSVVFPFDDLNNLFIDSFKGKEIIIEVEKLLSILKSANFVVSKNNDYITFSGVNDNSIHFNIDKSDSDSKFEDYLDVSENVKNMSLIFKISFLLKVLDFCFSRGVEKVKLIFDENNKKCVFIDGGEFLFAIVLATPIEKK